MQTRLWRILPLLALIAPSAAFAGPPAETGDEPPSAVLKRLLPAEAQQALPLSLAQACCKTCRKGKACGDSCIAREKLCEKPRGCACDADPLQ